MNESVQQQDYDLIIVGGGMVGATLATAMRNSGLHIAVVEAYPFDSEQQPSFDDRSIALAYGTQRILQSMGIWNDFIGQLEAINTIHVSDRGHFGATRLHHDEEGVDALGYVIENRVYGRIMMDYLHCSEKIELLCPANVQAIEQDGSQVSLTIEQDGTSRQISSRLLVAADGMMSPVRQLLGIGVRRQEYSQCAVIANVTTDKPHRNVAYERFTDTGPLAFLPMTGQRYSVVWTIDKEEQDSIMALSDEAFIARLQERFGYRQGRITKTGRRNVYPLAMVESEQLVQDRVVIIGNAAHALHPVSGQGFNLAIRDVALLAELMTEHGLEQPQSWLSEYSQSRDQDMTRVFRVTDGLVKIFSNRLMPLAHARALGLMMVDCIPSLRHALARQSMGFSGRSSRLQRGLSL